MTKKQITILYTSIIGSLINEFTMKESTRAINTVKKRVKKYMAKQGDDKDLVWVEALSHGHRIWVKAIDCFTEEKMRIDVYSLIIAIWGEWEDELSKKVGLTEKVIEGFMNSAPKDHSTESELNSYKVAKYMTREIEMLQVKS